MPDNAAESIISRNNNNGARQRLHSVELTTSDDNIDAGRQVVYVY